MVDAIRFCIVFLELYNQYCMTVYYMAVGNIAINVYPSGFPIYSLLLQRDFFDMCFYYTHLPETYMAASQDQVNSLSLASRAP